MGFENRIQRRGRSRVQSGRSAGEWIAPLERRQLMSTVVVNSTSDATAAVGSSISLRAAIAIANASTTATTITFSPSVFATNQTISISNGVLALTNTSAATTITGPAAGVTIKGNATSNIFFISSDVVASLSNMTVTGGDGSGISNDGNATISNTTITGNIGANGAGIYNVGGPQYGYDANAGTAVLVDDTISGNTASANGGGIENDNNGSLTVINSTIANNTAVETGGGVLNQNGAHTTLTNCTVSGNFVTGLNNQNVKESAGAGIYNAFGTFTLGNTIVAGNTTDGLDPDAAVFFFSGAYAGSITSLGNNFIGISNYLGATDPYRWIASDIVGTTTELSAGLGTLANNGGLTPTLLPLAGSPVIDAGSNALIPAGITTDQRGLARISGKAVDIGSVEVQQSVVQPAISLTANRSSAGISLTWTATAGTTGPYSIDRGNYSTGESATPIAASVSSNAFTDPTSDLTSGTDYYYTVKGITSGAASQPSNEATAFAPGPYFAPSVNFGLGIPATSSGQFTVQNSIFENSPRTGEASIAIGGSAQYNTPLSANHFATNFQFQQPAGDSGAFALAVDLETSAGKKVGIFNDGATVPTLQAIGGDSYGVQLGYNGQTLTVNVQDQNNQSAGTAQSFTETVNLPAMIGSSSGLATFIATTVNQSPLLNYWQYANSISGQAPTPQIFTSSTGITLEGLDPGTAIYRGTAPGKESPTPIAVNQNVQFTDTTAVPGVTYYYVAVTTAPGVEDSTASSEVSGTVPTLGAQPLPGIPIGTNNSWDGINTIAKVFDGNLNTYFDPANGNLTNWVGLDLEKNATITQISFAPRAGYAFRMVGGQFQVSSTIDFSSNVKTLYTITTAPQQGVLTTVSVNPGAGYRYVRYVGGSQWVNIAEMQITGIELYLPAAPVQYPGTPIGAGGEWWPGHDGIFQASDGDLTTYFDPANGNLTNWVGFDLGTPKPITQITFAPRAGYEFRMLGGQFQVSSDPNFATDVHTIYTVTAIPASGQLTTVAFESIGSYRYVRYTGGTQWVNIAEMQFAGPVPPVPFTGTAIGTAAAWNPNSTITAAFDGNINTYFDPANNSLANWVGLDLGSARTITQIVYAARAGFEYRMVGAQIQVSSTADFSSDVHTIYTITSAPAAGQAVTVAVPASTYRYIRYVGGTQWVNIAELEVDGSN